MEDELSHQIIGASIEVHKILGGPGLLESIGSSYQFWVSIREGWYITYNKWHLINLLSVLVPSCLCV
jgi:hypothetical protein